MQNQGRRNYWRLFFDMAILPAATPMRERSQKTRYRTSGGIAIMQGPATTLPDKEIAMGSIRCQARMARQPGAPKTGDHGLQCSGSMDPNCAFSKHRYCEPCGNHRLYLRPLVATGKRRVDDRRCPPVLIYRSLAVARRLKRGKRSFFKPRNTPNTRKCRMDQKRWLSFGVFRVFRG